MRWQVNCSKRRYLTSPGPPQTTIDLDPPSVLLTARSYMHGGMNRARNTSRGFCLGLQSNLRGEETGDCQLKGGECVGGRAVRRVWASTYAALWVSHGLRGSARPHSVNMVVSRPLSIAAVPNSVASVIAEYHLPSSSVKPSSTQACL